MTIITIRIVHFASRSLRSLNTNLQTSIILHPIISRDAHPQNILQITDHVVGELGLRDGVLVGQLGTLASTVARRYHVVDNELLHVDEYAVDVEFRFAQRNAACIAVNKSLTASRLNQLKVTDDRNAYLIKSVELNSGSMVAVKNHRQWC